jgi:hypothetical protein
MNNYIVLFSFILSICSFCHLFKVENLIVQNSIMKFQQNSSHQYLLFILYLHINVRCTRTTIYPKVHLWLSFICVFRLHWLIQYKWNIVKIHLILCYHYIADHLFLAYIAKGQMSLINHLMSSSIDLWPIVSIFI